MTTSVSPDARRIWHAVRGPVAILLVIVAGAVLITLILGTGTGGALDPRSTAPDGSRALARLLAAEGVRVEPVDTVEGARESLAGGADTLLITVPARLRPELVAELRGLADRLVLITPPPDVLAGLDLPVRPAGATEVTDRPPDCGYDRAGVARTGGEVYAGTAELCYADSLARLPEVTLLGTGSPLTNARLDEQGNAALSMRLLGEHERLVWYVPSLTDPDALPEQRTLLDLLPDGWVFGLVQLAVAVAVVALWRARRLGPVVTEPLPVVVRAAETVEGRAGLYRRSGAAGHAATALRQAARDRLVGRLGLPRDAGPHAVVGALAERTGRPGPQLYDLLYGPAPAGDAALVRLVADLDALESQT
ncbi:MAG TPA: DUF4350 domain-containing protein [Actinophytocola sp.]|uniref:DUF4350 domain-containing protein n=1 Tax=Actinophytocola sp. TaxID=1872138 RepID=UPI002DBAC552|nr:DUF4350 domain-containing protein [Actinophytocola sp.]HEU5476057.1 DUF4350 domain-containing protein [Actinophytocola sp.]